MGNTSSNNKYGNDTEVDTLNWGNFNTDEVSIKEDEYINQQNMPKGLEYLNNLEIPESSASEVHSEKFVASKVDTTLGLPDKLTDITETVSATSPFISSEMYKFVMKGGAEKDDSASSSTSSSSDEHKDHKDHKDHKEHKDHKDHKDHKEHKEHKEHKDKSSSSSSSHKSDHSAEESHANVSSEDLTQTGGSSVTSASYISSSEHCGGPNSDDEVNSNSAVSTEDRIVSSSLNTSDINLISLKN